MHEELRLAALESYANLGSSAEPGFDRFVADVAKIFAVPVAFISMVGRESVCLKAAVGMQAGDKTREGSFCSYVVRDRDLLVVPDAATDPRFAGHPSVAGEPGFRFYAGAPLLTREGAAIGALAVMDVKSRSFSEQQEAVLEKLGQTAMSLLEERRISVVRDWIVSGLERELQTAVAGLRSLASSVLRPGGGTDHANQMIEILHQTERLDGLLDTLHDLTRFGLGETPPQIPAVCNVRALCEDVIEEMASGAGVRFDFEGSGDCQGFWDPAVLTRAAMLIIEEARSRSPEDATVRIRASGERTDAVFIEVALPTRLDGPSLRIHLARELILRAGGQIRFRRENGESIFSLFLPRFRE